MSRGLLAGRVVYCVDVPRADMSATAAGLAHVPWFTIELAVLCSNMQVLPKDTVEQESCKLF